MLRGGVCLLDEGNRMNEKSWASLAPLFDQRRYVESIVAGITLSAHPDFRARRDDEPGRIDLRGARLHPQPPPADLAARLSGQAGRDGHLQYHLPFAEPQMLAMTVEFLQQAHQLKLDFSPATASTCCGTR
jgi:hypothetical protein